MTIDYRKTINEILNELDNNFKDRKEKLQNLKRYHKYNPMFYRTNLYNHSRRVAWMTARLAPFIKYAFPEFNFKKAFAIALIHDDPELLTGDIQASQKDKMTEEQLKEIDKNEEKAIDILSKDWPTEFSGFNYKELSLDVVRLISIEAYVVKYIDKLDTFGEALHELFSGNRGFVSTPDSSLGKLSAPYDFFIKKLPNYTKEYPKIDLLLNQKNFPYKTIPELDQFKTVDSNEPHTSESIRNKTGYLPYDFWIETILEFGTPKQIEELYTKKE